MFRYETHLHTSPASKCGKATAEESLRFYREEGYDGVFITNHFLDGNFGGDRSRPYEEQIRFYFEDYERGAELAEKIGIRVFPGVEMSYGGTDFLVYGLAPAWYLAHPEILSMKKSEELAFLQKEGALIIQAHPFREAAYIDHIRLFPRCVEGVEILNACRTDFENEMAKHYARAYGLLPFAGSDNHVGRFAKRLAGIETEEPLRSVGDLIDTFRRGETHIFVTERG